MARVLLLLLLLSAAPATARDFTSSVSEGGEIAHLRPEFKVPDEPGQLFYIQRSPNSNTVVYAAKLDGKGNFDSKTPVEAFWRKFNIDGSQQPLNFVERLMAYGVRMDAAKPGQPASFAIAALPQRKLTLGWDGQHHAIASVQIGGRIVRLVYVYLQVDERGLVPNVPSLDLLGFDIASGKAIHEHLVQK